MVFNTAMRRLLRPSPSSTSSNISRTFTLPTAAPSSCFHTSSSPLLPHSPEPAPSTPHSRAAGSAAVTRHPLSPHLPSGVAVLAEFIVSHAKGSYVHSTKGGRYLDFTCGIGVTNLGHCHPRVDAAVAAQFPKGSHLQVNCYTSQSSVDFARKLGSLLPPGFTSDYQVLLSNSGAEAIENAVKLSRVVTGRQTVIVFSGGFHGRTIGAGALTTAKYVYRAGFQPTMAGVHVAPFPYCQHCSIAGASKGEFGFHNCCMDPVKQLRMVLKQQTAGDEVAAVLIEPVQGEAGYVVPPPGFMQEVRRVCDDIGALLIADEVQCGYGRTGHAFAIQHSDGVVPDIIVAAKGIANGYPLSAMITSAANMSRARSGSIGGTYGGNAVSCAAASAVIDTFHADDILGNVRARGTQLRAGLTRLKDAGYPIADVRGLGLMIGLEFDQAAAGEGVAAKVSKACVKEELLLLTCGVYDTIRFIPPLIASEQEVNEGLDKFERALKAVTRK